jgi:hypothetical protein
MRNRDLPTLSSAKLCLGEFHAPWIDEWIKPNNVVTEAIDIFDISASKTGRLNLTLYIPLLHRFFYLLKHLLTSLSSCGRSGLLLAFLSVSTPNWAQFGPVTNYATGATKLTVGDVNADGRLDIVTTNIAFNAVGVLLGQLGGFAPVVVYSSSVGTEDTNPNAVAVGDVNSDGRVDIVVANVATSEAGVLYGKAGGGFLPVTGYSTGPNAGIQDVALADMDGDGRLDIVTANSATVGVLLAQAGGGFAPAVAYPAGFNVYPAFVAAGDVNNDGRMDIVTASYSSPLSVLLGRNGGGYSPATVYFAGSNTNPQDLALGDVDGNGYLDIITANYGTNTVGVMLAQPTGNDAFGVPISYSTGAGSKPRGVAVADVNNDGRLDVVTANENTSTAGVLLGRAGGFASVVAYSTATNSRPIAVALGDMNNDGRPDIVTDNYSRGAVGVLLNTNTTPLATTGVRSVKLAFYPNPAHTSLTLSLTDEVSRTMLRLSLIDATGRTVYAQMLPPTSRAEVPVELGQHPAGLYQLRLEGPNGYLAAQRLLVR